MLTCSAYVARRPRPPNNYCNALMVSSMYDVSWCHSGGRVAASLSNGGVAIWDLQHLATDADMKGDDSGKIIGNHERSVNRLCWDPHDHGQLLSGSQVKGMRFVGIFASWRASAMGVLVDKYCTAPSRRDGCARRPVLRCGSGSSEGRTVVWRGLCSVRYFCFIC